MKHWIILVLSIMTIMTKAQTPISGNCAIIGHRGVPGYGGENTLWGFQKALDLGADGFELDLIPTKDGKLIVGHDFDLDRLIGKGQLNEVYPNRPHIVTEYTQEELQTLKVTFPAPDEERYAYHKLDNDYVMPTLGQVLDLLLKNRNDKKREDLKIYIEIKTKEKFMHTISLNEISAQITNELKKRDLLEDQNVWIQSFDYDMMDVISANPLLNEIPKCQLAFDGIGEVSKFRKEGKARKFLKKKIVNRNLQMLHVWKVPAKYVMEKKAVPFIDIAHEMGIPIHLYTFRDPRFASDYKIMSGLGVKGFNTAEEELRYFMEKGVDAIMTDYVSSAIAVRNRVFSSK